MLQKSYKSNMYRSVSYKWDKLFKNRPSKVCGRQPLKNFTCSVLEYFVSNVPRSFQSTCVLGTGLSDFRLIIMTDMRKCFEKFQPNIISSRSYKNFSNDADRETLVSKLSFMVLTRKCELPPFC